MPNWCSTSVGFTGKEEDLQSFYEDFKKSQGIKVEEAADNWIGKIFVMKGIDYKPISCRAFLSDIELCPGYVMMQCEEAWCAHPEAYDKFAEMYNLEHVYVAEESGMGYYINTDAEGRFFTDNYIVEVYDANNEFSESEDPIKKALWSLNEDKYFSNLELITDKLNEAGAKVKTSEDVKKLCQDYSNEDVCINFNEYDAA